MVCVKGEITGARANAEGARVDTRGAARGPVMRRLEHAPMGPHCGDERDRGDRALERHGSKLLF